MTIARNIIIDRSRKKKPDTSLDDEYENGSPLRVAKESGPGPRDNVANTELNEKISMAVKKLPDDQKEVFLMRMQANMAFKEIAKMQKISINTALARMQYAVAKLREELQEDYFNLA